MPKLNINSAPSLVTTTSETAFPRWLETAKTGDVVIYHMGYYASGPHFKAAWKAAMDDAVELVQVKLPSVGLLGSYAYCAIKRRGARRG